MDKDEILKKSRQENRNGDERVKLESDKASTFGMVGMALVFFALFLIRFFRDGEAAYDLFAVFFSFFAFSGIYRAVKLKGWQNILNAALYSVAAVLWFILYIWKG